MNFWQTTMKALGAKGALLLAIGSSGGLLLSSVDLGFTLLLHSLFYKLGFQDVPSSESGSVFLDLSTPALALALCGIGFARSLSFFAVHNASATAHEHAAIRLRLIRFYLSLKKNASTPFSPGELQHAIHDTYPKTASFFRQLATGLGLTFYTLGLVAVMAYHAPWLALISVIGLALFAPVFLTVRGKISASAEHIPRAHRQLMLGIEHISQNWLFVRVMRLLDGELSRITSHAIQLSSERLKISRATMLANALVSVAGILTLVGAVFLGFLFESSPGVETVAFAYLFIRMVQNLAGLMSIVGSLVAAKPQFQRCAEDLREVSALEIRKAIKELVAMANTEVPGSPRLTAAHEPKRLEPPEISVKNLCFSYRADAPAFLNGLSLQIQSGGFCALVGESGSGKTTLIALVAGLLEPTSGDILVGGESPEKFFGGPSARVGFVGSTAYLVSGTIRDNLCLGLDITPSDEALEQALVAARIAEKVSSLPNGLEHELLNSGEGLSSGEKQRLCLARALLNQPSVLFLDEMSANLDEKTEKLIAQSLSELKGSCTVIFTTHRTALLSLADQVISLPFLGNHESRDVAP